MSGIDNARLLELADEALRLRRADRWTDEKIAEALGWYSRLETGLGMRGRTPGRTVWRKPNGVKAPVPKFTGSIDAAMTLLDPFWRGQIQFGEFPGAWIAPDDGEDADDFNIAATPALAICAASLRAKAVIS